MRRNGGREVAREGGALASRDEKKTPRKEGEGDGGRFSSRKPMPKAEGKWIEAESEVRRKRRQQCEKAVIWPLQKKFLYAALLKMRKRKILYF